MAAGATRPTPTGRGFQEVDPTRVADRRRPGARARSTTGSGRGDATTARPAAADGATTGHSAAGRHRGARRADHATTRTLARLGRPCHPAPDGCPRPRPCSSVDPLTIRSAPYSTRSTTACPRTTLPPLAPPPVDPVAPTAVARALTWPADNGGSASVPGWSPRSSCSSRRRARVDRRPPPGGRPAHRRPGDPEPRVVGRRPPGPSHVGGGHARRTGRTHLRRRRHRAPRYPAGPRRRGAARLRRRAAVRRVVGRTGAAGRPRHRVDLVDAGRAPPPVRSTPTPARCGGWRSPCAPATVARRLRHHGVRRRPGRRAPQHHRHGEPRHGARPDRCVPARLGRGRAGALTAARPRLDGPLGVAGRRPRRPHRGGQHRRGR